MSYTPQELAAQALARAQRSEVSLPSANTAYWTYPATDAPGGNSRGTIVFVHGYRGNHHGLEPIVGALTDFDIIVPDLPGFGFSAAFQGRHTVVAYAEWLEQFVSALKLDTAVVLGHSFGSIVAAAAAHRGLTNTLVLVNPVASFERTGREKVLESLTNAFYGLSGKLPEKAGNGLLRNPLMVRVMSEVLAKTKNPALRAWIHKQHDENFSEFAERRVATEGYVASMSRSVSSYARGIENQTLLIAGELDDITSLADEQRLLRMFAHAELKVIRGVGHLIHYETPTQAAGFVREFLTDAE
jgi:pimeloyl-ACP methyl ester carboxylesterase